MTPTTAVTTTAVVMVVVIAAIHGDKKATGMGIKIGLARGVIIVRIAKEVMPAADTVVATGGNRVEFTISLTTSVTHE